MAFYYIIMQRFMNSNHSIGSSSYYVGVIMMLTDPMCRS
jgi:hypothetical protein